MEAVQPGQVQHLIVFGPAGVQMVLKDDAILRQGAGFVGAQHVHRAKVLNGVQTLDHHFASRHGDSALRQVGTDDHRQHFWRQPNRHRQGKQRGFAPVAFGEPVDQQHNGHHHQHKADQQPTDAVNPAIKRGLRTGADNRLRQRPEIGASAGCHHHRRGGTTGDVSAHQADVRQLQQRMFAGDFVLTRFLADVAHNVVFLNRDRLAGQNGLADKQIARRQQANVRRYHIPGRELNNIARHQFADRDLQRQRMCAVAAAAHYRCGGSHHRLQRLRRLVGAVFLPEAQ
ncbi:hypothetical protein D3C80_610140 [compost metagenome]